MLYFIKAECCFRGERTSEIVTSQLLDLFVAFVTFNYLKLFIFVIVILADVFRTAAEGSQVKNKNCVCGCFDNFLMKKTPVTYELSLEELSKAITRILWSFRPEMDTEWTYIREPIETNSMVLKGLIPETAYQFVVRAVSAHGVSPPSNINNPVRTLGKAERRRDLTKAQPGLPPPTLLNNAPTRGSAHSAPSLYPVVLRLNVYTLNHTNPSPGDRRCSQLCDAMIQLSKCMSQFLFQASLIISG